MPAAANAGRDTHLSAELRQALLPEATEFADAAEPLPHLVGFSAGKKPVGVLFVTTDLAPDVEGFNGPVPTAVGLGLDGVIRGIHILRTNRETPGYIDLVYESRSFHASFSGKDSRAPLEYGSDVEAVSGATFSASGVTEGVRLSVRRAVDELLPHYRAAAGVTRVAENSPSDVSTEWPQPVRFSVDSVLRRHRRTLVIVALFAMALWNEHEPRAWRRTIILATALACLGFSYKVFFSIVHVFDMLEALRSLRLGLAMRTSLWGALTAAALGGALLMGRIYCSYLCPFGALTEFLARLSRAPWRVGPRMDRALRRVKTGVLALLVLVFLATGDRLIAQAEPFADTFIGGFCALPGLLGSVWIAWLAFLFIASLLVSRFFCRYLCPAGALMALLARFRIFGRCRPNRCRECGECGVSCPLGRYDVARGFGARCTPENGTTTEDSGTMAGRGRMPGATHDKPVATLVGGGVLLMALIVWLALTG